MLPLKDQNFVDFLKCQSKAYVTRLRHRAVHCNFSETDESIRDQLSNTEICASQRLRPKLLEMDNPSLELCIKVALSLETSES